MVRGISVSKGCRRPIFDNITMSKNFKKILNQRVRVVPENVKNNAICMNLDTHSAFHQLLPIYSLGQFIF